MSYDGYSKYDAAVAASYDRDRQDEIHWQAEHACVRAFAASRNLGAVLDLPVGTGRFFDPLRSAESIVGVDISEHMLAMADETRKSLRIEHVRLMKGDALALPFQAGTFDSVICFRLAHLLPREMVPSLFRELARVCRGRILLQLYVYDAEDSSVRWSLVRRLARPLRRLLTGVTRKQPWSHIQSYSHTWEFLEHGLAEAGLTIEKRHRLGLYAGSSVEVLELSK